MILNCLYNLPGIFLTLNSLCELFAKCVIWIIYHNSIICGKLNYEPFMSGRSSGCTGKRSTQGGDRSMAGGCGRHPPRSVVVMARSFRAWSEAGSLPYI